jgi:hypothetical protein
VRRTVVAFLLLSSFQKGTTTMKIETVEQIVTESRRIAEALLSVSVQLDANISKVDSAADRGALSRLQRAAHDTAYALAARQTRHSG